MQRRGLLLFPLVAVVLGLSASPSRAAEPVMADWVLKGGVIHDGAGSPPREGHVAIRNGKIVAVGNCEIHPAAQQIDCTGLVIAPGFIDLHNHSDNQVVDPLTRGNINYLMQGCTTVVTGNCGSGPVDVAGYYDRIDAAGAGTHVIHLLPQGSLRDYVLGTEQREATEKELARMRELAAKAMRDGAWGMSSGLIYVPSSYASTDELVEIATVVAQHGGIYASHIRGEGTGLLNSVNEALEIGRRSGAAVHVSHFKASGPEAWGLVRQAAAMIEKARAAGQTVTADQYPYIASSTSLTAMLIPTWARAGGDAALKKRLDDPEQGAKIREAILNDLAKRGDVAPIRLARYAPRPDWIGKNLQEIAAAENREVLDIVLEITRKGGAAAVSFGMNEEDVRFVMQQPWVATASDGRAYVPGSDRPHPRSYGTFSRKIGHYAIEQGVVPLAQAIRSSSGLPAEILGLKDRGYVKEGLAADVVVFAPEEFRDQATFNDPHRYSSGVRYVFVAGKPAVFAGTPTGALAGRALRRNASEKEAAENR